ncbi:C2 domain [Pseudocohnilembus persalinus]|uniref:C2 domain n=1 Tax=Pseudocohnilembus persalinus TaxID=266149 RepID=A0A0V0QKA3_PSEPJ|nr:C2 domain [Pseudocohnilembus persalinus]|eukprot:KRX02670.1 C2 domain [Pseudocohnilembus persalinus]
MTEKERNDEYFRRYDENEKLKHSQKILEKKIEISQSHLNNLQNQFNSTKRRTQIPEQKNESKQFQKETELKKLQEENKRLHEKLKNMTEYIKPQQDIRKAHRAIGNDPKYSKTDLQQKFDTLKKSYELLRKQLRQQEDNTKGLQMTLNSKVQITTKEQHDKNLRVVGQQAQIDELKKQSERLREDLDRTKQRCAELNANNRDLLEKVTDLERSNRLLELSSENAHELQEEINNLRKEKDRVENQLKDLAQSPFFRGQEEKINSRQQINNLSEELRQKTEQNIKLQAQRDEYKNQATTYNEQYIQLKQLVESLKEQNIQQKVSLDTQNKQMAPFRELQRMDPEVYLKALGSVKHKSEGPDWAQYANMEEEQELKTYSLEDQNQKLKEMLNQARQSYGELAIQLNKIENMYHTQVDINKESERLHKIQNCKLELQLKAALSRADELARLADLRGVRSVNDKYEDKKDVIYVGESNSKFDPDDLMTELGDKAQNYFDLWIGQVYIEDANVAYATDGQIKTMRDNISFATVDFYDHDTQHTHVAQGLNSDYNLQLAFKVDQDQSLINYLRNGYLKIEIFAALGIDAIKLGSANVSLSKLLENTDAEKVSRICGDEIFLYAKNDQNRNIAQIQIKYKMRFSIYNTLKWINDLETHITGEQRYKQLEAEQRQENVEQKERKLTIVIEQGIQLPANSNSFVYYQFNGEDFYSQTQFGENPRWDFHQQHIVNYNNDFIAFLKRESLKIIIFDDSQNIYSHDQTDIIGTVNVELESLIKAPSKKFEIAIFNSYQKKLGTMKLRVFWNDAIELNERIIGQDNTISSTLEQEITLKIATALQQRMLGLRTAFLIFDRDQDKVIGYEDFSKTVQETLNLKISTQEMEFYYRRLKQPFNEVEFNLHFQNLISKRIEQQQVNQATRGGLSTQKFRGSRFNDPAVQSAKQEIGNLINKKLNKGITIIELFNEINTGDSDGLVDLYELKAYLRQHEIHKDNDELASFLAVIDRNNDQQINIQEFFEFVLEDVNPEQIEILKRQKLGRGTKNEGKIQQDVEAAKKQILEYMKMYKMTFETMHQKMDLNEDNYVSPKEFKNFFLKEFSHQINEVTLNALVYNFDLNKDGLVDFNEFVNQMQLAVREMDKREYYYALFSGSQTSIKESTNQAVLNGIALYMQSNNLTIDQLFNVLDQRGQGRLISSGRGNQKVSQAEQRRLKKTLEDFAQSKVNLLFKIYQQNETGKGIVPSKIWKKALIDNGIPLLDRDLDTILRDTNIVRTDIVHDQVDYLFWLSDIDEDIIKDYKISGAKFSDALKLSKNVFQKIQRLAQQNKMNQRDLFNKFDVNFDGRISINELEKPLQKMFSLSENEIKQVLNAVDTDGDKEISYAEFITILNYDRA